MDEMLGMIFWFGLVGLLAGGVLGWLGSRLALLICLGLAVAAVAVQGVQAGLDHGWGTMQHALYAGLTLWGIGIALVAVAVVKVVRTLRDRRNSPDEDDLR